MEDPKSKNSSRKFYISEKVWFFDTFSAYGLCVICKRRRKVFSYQLHAQSVRGNCVEKSTGDRYTVQKRIKNEITPNRD